MSSPSAVCTECTGARDKAIPSGYEPFVLRATKPQRAGPGDWAPLVAEMSRVQRLVHLAGRMTIVDQQELGDRLFTESRETYRQALANEAARAGCKAEALPLSAGLELSALRQRADWAASSVTGTYNVNLGREILKIGDETPTANRHVYAHRLYYKDGSWDKTYWAKKSVEISQVETMTSINGAVADFHARNGDLVEAEAEVVPLMAICPICQAMVAGNPWRSVDEVFRRFEIPPHPGCPHQVRSLVKRKLTSEECAELWIGG